MRPQFHEGGGTQRLDQPERKGQMASPRIWRNDPHWLPSQLVAQLHVDQRL